MRRQQVEEKMLWRVNLGSNLNSTICSVCDLGQVIHLYEPQFPQLEKRALLDLLTWVSVRNKNKNVHEKSR